LNPDCFLYWEPQNYADQQVCHHHHHHFIRQEVQANSTCTVSSIGRTTRQHTALIVALQKMKAKNNNIKSATQSLHAVKQTAKKTQTEKNQSFQLWV